MVSFYISCPRCGTGLFVEVEIESSSTEEHSEPQLDTESEQEFRQDSGQDLPALIKIACFHCERVFDVELSDLELGMTVLR